MIRDSNGFESQPWHSIWGKGGHLSRFESHTMKDTQSRFESHTSDVS